MSFSLFLPDAVNKLGPVLKSDKNSNPKQIK